MSTLENFNRAKQFEQETNAELAARGDQMSIDERLTAIDDAANYRREQAAAARLEQRAEEPSILIIEEEFARVNFIGRAISKVRNVLPL